MADARDVEGSVTGVDWGHKHGAGGSKSVPLVTANEEDYYHATNIKASENISAILSIEISIGF